MSNDPELQHLQQDEANQAPSAVTGDGSDNGDETQPLTSNTDQGKSDYGTIESELTSTVNIPKPKSKSKHQALPSESMDSVISAEQTRIMHENIGTDCAISTISPMQINASILSDTSEYMTPKTPLVCKIINFLFLFDILNK